MIQNTDTWEGFFSYQPTKVLEWLLNSPCKITALFCIAADEYIYTENGPRLAGSLKAGDGLDMGNSVVCNSIAEDDLYEVTFGTGVKIKCNGQHLLYWRPHRHSSYSEGFKRVDELIQNIGYKGKKGYVKFSYADNFEGEQLKSPKLLGYLCSDGYITNLGGQSPKFTNNNVIFLDEVKFYAKMDFDIDGRIIPKNNGFDILLTGKHGQKNNLTEYIRSLEISTDSYGKIITGDRDSLIEFVKGFFNGDGYLLLRRRKEGWSDLPSIEVGFCIGSSYNRAVEFQYLLWKIGIQSWIVGEYMKSSKHKFYRVKVNAHNADKILDILDNSKYPEKFIEAKTVFAKGRYPRKDNGDWNTIRNIQKVGRGEIAVLTSTSGEFISYCGMVNHNTGNQFGKNETVIMDFSLGWLGMHPNPHKNVKPTDDVRTFRFASETLPGEKQEEEVKNTQYPAMKRRYPSDLWIKDITVRKPNVTLMAHDNKPINIEFVSYGQPVQAGAGVQRRRIWIDEECNRDFFEEQIPRLLRADGDIVMSFTPVPGSIGWEFDELYERAKYIYRTKAVRDRIKERFGEDVPELEVTDSKDDICVIIAATDDNPVYAKIAEERSKLTGVTISAKEYIDDMFNIYSDEDVIDARRYGLFRQLSGKIYKEFLASTHVVPFDMVFPKGVPDIWKHARGIDYHQQNPWACVWISISPEDEIFVWCDYEPSSRLITYDVCLEVAHRSGDYKYFINLIDPLANEKQKNTNLTTTEDINRYFREFRRDGVSTGGYFEGWDTKGTRGREEFKKRLTNAMRVGRPFNNKVIDYDQETGIPTTKLLPTIWITDNCMHVIDSLKNWRLDDYGSREMLAKNDPKEIPQKKWSHFPTAIECLLKEPMISRGKFGTKDSGVLRPKRYMTGAR